MNRAVILTIGDEILFGHIFDSNAQWLANQLSMAGLDVVFKMTTGDNPELIIDALGFAFDKADVLLVTGGLGPTKDDITKKILAEWFSTQLEILPIALKHLEEKLMRRARPMNDMVMKQALHPVSATYLKNEMGTAPGIWFSEKGKICIAMPGVPYEMKQIFTDEVLPRLQSQLSLDVILHRFIRTVGVPETTLALAVNDIEESFPPNIKMAYLPSGGLVKLRITAKGFDSDMLQKELDAQEEMIFKCISEYVYARQDKELESIVSEILLQKQFPLKINDNLTEGRIAYLLMQENAVQNLLSLGANPETNSFFLIQTTLQKDLDGMDIQHLLAAFYQNGILLKQKVIDIRIFPVKDVNRNMVSLRSIDLLRRLILDDDANFGI